MAIQLNKVNQYSAEDDTLKGKSKFWGFPDMPSHIDYPYKDEDPLCFLCQINLEELHLKTNNHYTKQLPNKGMLYFFAQIDYFLGWTDEMDNGIGSWNKESFKVIYTDDISELFTHKTYFEDQTPAALDAWSIDFVECQDNVHGHKLLGKPFFEEIPSKTSLLQIDEDDDWGLRFYDSGMINFTIDEKSLQIKDFDKVRFYFHSL